MGNKRFWLVALLLLGAALVGAFATWFDLSALPTPGPVETYAARKIKQWLVYRESRGAALQEPSTTSESPENGGLIFQSDCAFCHGSDGRNPSNVGRALYPRAPALVTAEVQGWSDPELFWIVRNGIRLSGMPAFGKQLSHEQIWNLVRYIRSLKTGAQPSNNKAAN